MTFLHADVSILEHIMFMEYVYWTAGQSGIITPSYMEVSCWTQTLQRSLPANYTAISGGGRVFKDDDHSSTSFDPSAESFDPDAESAESLDPDAETLF